MFLIFLGYQFQNGLLRVVDAENALACANHCAIEIEPKCRSFNFIEDGMIVQNCELLSRVASVVDDGELVPRNGVSFFEKIKKGGSNYFIENYENNDCL